MRKLNPVKLLACFLALGTGAVAVACHPTSDNGAQTTEPAISEKEAMQSAAALIEDVFAVTIDTDYTDAENTREDWYTVYVNQEDGEDFDYYAFVDYQTGEVLHVSRSYNGLTLTSGQREDAEAYAARNDGAASGEDLIDACTPIAQALVERVFADGRTVTQTQFGSIMTDSEISPTQEVAICVRMDEGACYTVTVVWPQMEVFSASVYPLGWHSCVYGYQDPDEADEYPPLED